MKKTPFIALLVIGFFISTIALFKVSSSVIDSDGDGFLNNVDACTYAYSLTNNGCPDQSNIAIQDIDMSYVKHLDSVRSISTNITVVNYSKDSDAMDNRIRIKIGDRVNKIANIYSTENHVDCEINIENQYIECNYPGVINRSPSDANNTNNNYSTRTFGLIFNVKDTLSIDNLKSLKYKAIANGNINKDINKDDNIVIFDDFDQDGVLGRADSCPFTYADTVDGCPGSATDPVDPVDPVDPTPTNPYDIGISNIDLSYGRFNSSTGEVRNNNAKRFFTRVTVSNYSTEYDAKNIVIRALIGNRVDKIQEVYSNEVGSYCNINTNYQTLVCNYPGILEKSTDISTNQGTTSRTFELNFLLKNGQTINQMKELEFVVLGNGGLSNDTLPADNRNKVTDLDDDGIHGTNDTCPLEYNPQGDGCPVPGQIDYVAENIVQNGNTLSYIEKRTDTRLRFNFKVSNIYENSGIMGARYIIVFKKGEDINNVKSVTPLDDKIECKIVREQSKIYCYDIYTHFYSNSERTSSREVKINVDFYNPRKMPTYFVFKVRALSATRYDVDYGNPDARDAVHVFNFLGGNYTRVFY